MAEPLTIAVARGNERLTSLTFQRRRSALSLSVARPHCYRCEEGHSQARCPLQRCFHCKAFGHHIRLCPSQAIPAEDEDGGESSDTDGSSGDSAGEGEEDDGKETTTL